MRWANAAQVGNLKDQLRPIVPLYTERLTMPLTMIHGEADTIVPLKTHATRMKAKFLDAPLIRLDDAGHMPHHTHPQVVLDAITDLTERAKIAN